MNVLRKPILPPALAAHLTPANRRLLRDEFIAIAPYMLVETIVFLLCYLLFSTAVLMWIWLVAMGFSIALFALNVESKRGQ